jgi:protein-L-isoaspartate(D-aspartate) O-methyltransferase
MDLTQARLNMIESQVRPNGVTDSRVIEAMAQVHRENFIPNAKRALAYLDGHVRLASADGKARYLLEPMSFARILQSAAIEHDDRVLVVGAGPGYGSAVVAQLAAHVVALESDPVLAAIAREKVSHVKTVEGPLGRGHLPDAPYDVIIVEGRLSEPPQALCDQLAEGGRLVTGMGDGPNTPITIMTRTEGHISSRAVFDAALPELPGFPVPKPAFVF